MKKEKHKAHKYLRVKMGKDKDYIVYKCILPGCSHYVPRHLALGSLSVCNRCGSEHILDKANLERAKPYCKDCHKGKKDEAREETVKDILSNFGIR